MTAVSSAASPRIRRQQTGLARRLHSRASTDELPTTMSATDTTDTDRRSDAPRLPAAVREESPAAKLVYVTLRDAAEPLTYRELAESTALGRRTVKRAVLALREVDAVESVPAATAGAAPTTKQHRLVDRAR